MLRLRVPQAGKLDGDHSPVTHRTLNTTPLYGWSALPVTPSMSPLMRASQLNYLRSSLHFGICFGGGLTATKIPRRLLATQGCRDEIFALETTKHNYLRKDFMPWGRPSPSEGLPERGQGTAARPPSPKPPPQGDSSAKVHQSGPQHNPGGWRQLSGQNQTHTEKVISHSPLIAFRSLAHPSGCSSFSSSSSPFSASQGQGHRDTAPPGPSLSSSK